MFSTFLSTISGYFDRRFLLSAFFPVVAFAALSLGLGLALWGLQPALAFWQAQSALIQTLATVGALSLILFFAYMLQVFQTSLTRLYEGYWDGWPVLGWWAARRRDYYQQVWQYLTDESDRLAVALDKPAPAAPGTPAQEADRARERQRMKTDLVHLDQELLLSYPPEKADVMPTALGNILRASESYPMLRYQLDAVIAWPRLQGVLPKDFAEGLRDAKASLDMLLVVTSLAGLFALGWEIGLLFTGRWGLFLLASLAWPLALLCYSGVLQAASSYAELIKSAFDLYRWELLKAMHLKLPASYSDERKLWREVNELLYRNYPPDEQVFRYDVESKPPPAAPKPGALDVLLAAITRWLGLESGPEHKD